MAERLKFLLKSGWEYLKKAKTVYDIDSPFLFQLTNSIFDKENISPNFAKIENRRKNLLKDRSVFNRKDLGQGSLNAILNDGQVITSTWARNSSITPLFGRLLYRLVCNLKPAFILELGTAAGISTSYLASGLTKGKIITIEGDPVSASIARKTFDDLGLTDLELITGSFDEVLPNILGRSSPDMIFIDGHHQGQALMHYIDLIYPGSPNDISTIIVDDIRWSDDMYTAWKHLAADSRWQMSIDLFRIGLLIKNQNIHEHQEYAMIDHTLKPWRLGFLR